MGSFSDYLEDEVLNHVFGGGTYPQPGTLYAAAYTVSPSDAGGGTEATGGSYARVAIVNNATNFPAASGGAKSNGTTITFPQATALWGDIVAIGLLDASTSGNLLGWDDFAAIKIDDGDTLEIPAGDLDITLD